MLHGNNNRFDALGLVILILDSDLDFAIRTNALDDAIFHGAIKLSTNAMSKYERERKFFYRLICGITINSALVASAEHGIPRGISRAGVQRLIHSTSDILALLVDEYKHNELPRIVADLLKNSADHPADVYFFRAGDFARYDDFAFCRHDLTGHAGRFIFAEARIENAVCNQVAEFIWVTLADTFRSFVFCHIIFLSGRLRAAP